MQQDGADNPRDKDLKLCSGPPTFGNIFVKNVATPETFVAKLSTCDF